MAPLSPGNVSCIVSGSALFHKELASPLMLGVIASIIALVPLIHYLGKRIKRLRKYSIKLALPLTALAIVLVLSVNYITIRPGLGYGAWLNGTLLHVRFYEDKIISISICESNMTLTGIKEALSMLSIRTNGLSDPVTGIHMGYYRTYSGEKAYVIIVTSQADKALVIHSKKGYVIIALRCTGKLYKELLEARHGICGSSFTGK